ncbi:glutathione S-transferase family protein [Thalassotalea sp. M1531]|uniref:Glutathione S-transferase family protein n=1 Tax=Thalassotalea algicola TaxID=2716224 RepID=A0A7Y0LC97_9GAMM|nr:glutathione S-transferase family protein [Thalassotalea algicola]NMP31538.1 glutathione S-transferase family protein [Thalassotalea algicola]
MKLYTFSPAPNPMRVGYMIKYKGLNIDTQEINLREKEQFNPEFQAVNPTLTVPALQLDNGELLTDAIAICVYLDSMYPDKPLMGSNKEEYAQIVGWLHKIYVEGLSAVADILRNSSEFFADRALPGKVNVKQLPELIERGKIRLAAFWQMLDEHLDGREFVVGQQFTQADIDAYVICNFAGWVKETVPQQCSNILRWLTTVKPLLDEE